MVIPKLSEQLPEFFTSADEVWIAMALIKKEGFFQIQQWIPSDCIQHFIIGLDLPTSPQVLRECKNKISPTFHAKIYKSNTTFHPKVYLVRKNNEYEAIIGSGNLSTGGLKENIELAYKVVDKNHCVEIRRWFESLYGNCVPITEPNIKKYEQLLEAIKEKEREIKILRAGLKLNEHTNNANALLERLKTTDFKKYFFKFDHFWALRPENAALNTDDADSERKLLYDRLIDLHQIIYPRFTEFGLDDLHKHYIDQYIVSHYFAVPNFTKKHLKSLWLHYSKSQDEISQYHDNTTAIRKKGKKIRNEDGFANHMRLQVIVHHYDVGIWLYIGKENNGSRFDRGHIRDLINNRNALAQLYTLISQLPNDYYINIDKHPIPCKEIKNTDELRIILRNDNVNVTSYIGRNLEFDNENLYQENFPAFVLTEFQRLYPLYQLLRHKIPS